MNSNTIKQHPWAWALLAALMAMVPAADAAAETDEAVSDTGPIVRRKVLYRSTRFELIPAASVTLNDPFRGNIMAGAGFNYHLTNEFGVGLTAAYGLLHPETDLSKNIAETLQNSPAAGRLSDISYSTIQWTADLLLSYVPIFGKFSFLKSMQFAYDIHLFGGLSLVNYVGSPAVDGGNVDSEVEGLQPGGALGAGFRLFLSDMVSLNLGIKSLIGSRAEVSSGSAKAELGQTLMTTVGVGIFLPGDVKISR